MISLLYYFLEVLFLLLRKRFALFLFVKVDLVVNFIIIQSHLCDVLSIVSLLNTLIVQLFIFRYLRRKRKVGDHSLPV